MKVIKHGRPIDFKKIEFTCPWCGCIFEASRNEYTVYSSQIEARRWADVICPDCKKHIQKDLPTSFSAY